MVCLIVGLPSELRLNLLVLPEPLPSASTLWLTLRCKALRARRASSGYWAQPWTKHLFACAHLLRRIKGPCDAWLHLHYDAHCTHSWYYTTQGATIKLILPNARTTISIITMRRMALCFVPGDGHAQIGFWLGWVWLPNNHTQTQTTSAHSEGQGCARE